MAMSIGKRKRQEENPDADSGSEDEGAMRARFQQAFESKFHPLELSKARKRNPEPDPGVEDDLESEESDWSGFADDEDVVEIIDRHTKPSEDQQLQRHEERAFMSSRPPASNERDNAIRKQQAKSTEDDTAEAANLKNDLALQRLLKESHLLDPDSFKATKPAPEGKGRLKSLDLRLKDLGAKESMSQQRSMPQSHRNGIAEKAASREERRRKDAAENGIILERPKGTGQVTKRRDRNLGGPAIGKFKGGTLKLNSRDVRSIESQHVGSRRGKGRR